MRKRAHRPRTSAARTEEWSRSGHIRFECGHTRRRIPRPPQSG